MNVEINKVPRSEVKRLISSHIEPMIDAVSLRKFNLFICASQSVWCSIIHGEFIGMWGVIPATLMSDSAYLWVYTNENVNGHQFLFIRHSQLALAEVLERYSMVQGHAVVGSDKSIKWLKWLGAEFFEPEGNLIPFVIRRKNG